MSVLVVLPEPVLAGPELELLTLARTLGEVDVAVFEAPTEAALEVLAGYGVERVLLAPAAERFLTPVAARALLSVVEASGAEVILFASTFANKEVAAVLALGLRAGLIIDAARVERGEDDRVVAAKRVFAGSWDVVCAASTDRVV
ncbi:MAG: electron transfer flavoprotein subunit alpha/FixB family protein, partial [Cellulomonadaceae bacterium]